MTGGKESSTWHGKTKMTIVQIAQEEVKRLGDSTFLAFSLQSSAQWAEQAYCYVCFMPVSTVPGSQLYLWNL